MRRTLTLLAALALIGPVVTSAQSTPSATPPASQPAAPRDLINQMLKPGAEKKKPLSPVQGQPLQDKTTLNPVAPGNRPVMLRREGGYIVDRTGRVTKSSDGHDLEFNFEADAGQAMQDPPMILLPNLALMMMQDQLKLTGKDLKFRVTGMVTEYMGRNYLLLQKVVTVNE
jgi:hypothetical protein